MSNIEVDREILEELRAIRELLERAPEVTYNVFVQGQAVDQNRLQTALDAHRRS